MPTEIVIDVLDVNQAKRENLMGFDREQMEDYFLSIGEKSFRAAQVMKWIHQVGVSDFTQMTNLSKTLRARLSETAEIRLFLTDHSCVYL